MKNRKLTKSLSLMISLFIIQFHQNPTEGIGSNERINIAFQGLVEEYQV